MDPIAQARNRTITREKRFQLLVEAVVDYAIYMIDPDGRIASWNAGAERINGYATDEAVGRHFSMFFTEEDRHKGLPQQALELAGSAGRFESEGWRLRKDGSRFWALAVLDAVRDETGTLIGFAKITRDMTERRRAEEALFESERRFRLLVDSITDYAIFMLDPAGCVINWNGGARRVMGYTAGEIIGRHVGCFYTEEDLRQGVPEHALKVAGTEGKYESEGWRVRKDGSRFFAAVVIDAIRDSNGELVGFAKITRDVTERQQAQIAIEQAREQLFQAQKLEALGQLTGGVAHDFNNLLTVIVGAAAMAERHADDNGKLRSLLGHIRQAAQRGEDLTRQLLAFSRRQPLRPEVLDLRDRLAALARLLDRSLRGDIRIVLELPPDLRPVDADPTQLELALLNVGLNARDAMPDGGTLTIAGENVALRNEIDGLAGDYVAIRLTDTGFGIPEDIRAKVFEPFFTTKEIGKGSGLGLSQAYGFAKQSGGSARIESEVGKGTTVTFYLPASDAVPAAPRQARAAPAKPMKPACGTILVVEDDPDVAELAVAALEQSGYSVKLAHEARSALTLLEGGEPIDFVFSDIVMPSGMNGVELAQRIRARFPKLPILLATGYSEAAASAEARAFPLITKPYDPDKLVAEIGDLIDASRNETP
jgi:PAS domain S-box-containing protein